MIFILYGVIILIIGLAQKKSKPRKRYTNGQYMHRIKVNKFGKNVGEFYL